MSEVIADRLELDNLTMLQHKRSYLSQDQARLQAGTAAIQSSINDMSAAARFSPSATASANGTINPSGVPTEDVDLGTGAIMNRCTINYPSAPTTAPATPTTPTPTPTPPAKSGLSPWWWLLVPAALLLGGLAWYFWPKPAPTTPTTPTPPVVVAPTQPPNWTGDTTVIWK